jgi:hypothetical protein
MSTLEHTIVPPMTPHDEATADATEALAAAMGLPNMVTLPIFVTPLGRLLMTVPVIVSRTPESPTGASAMAMIDTGCTASAISLRIARSLGLDAVGREPTFVIPQYQPAILDLPMYDVAFRVAVVTDGDAPLETGTLRVMCSPALEEQGYDVLLGFDVLQRCLLAINGPLGTFTLAYSTGTLPHPAPASFAPPPFRRPP